MVLKKTSWSLKYHYFVYSFPEIILRWYFNSGNFDRASEKRPRIEISDPESSADEWIPDAERIIVKSTRSLYPCEHCDQTFSRKRMIQTHMSLEHNKKLLFKCNVCAHVAASMFALKAHKKVEHEGKISNCHYFDFSLC